MRIGYGAAAVAAVDDHLLKIGEFRGECQYKKNLFNIFIKMLNKYKHYRLVRYYQSIINLKNLLL